MTVEGFLVRFGGWEEVGILTADATRRVYVNGISAIDRQKGGRAASNGEGMSDRS